jgi:hypothetical protein
MNSVQSMIRRVKDDIEKKMLGKDENTNIFKALSKNREDTVSAIANSNDDNKEYFGSIIQMVQGLELAIMDLEKEKNK